MSKMIPYIIAERNQNVVEVNTDFIVMHNNTIILGSFVDLSIKIKKVFADLIQSKSEITLKNRYDVLFEEHIRTYGEKYKYKLNKHDEKHTHGIIYNTRKDEYIFDWNNEGLVKSLTKYMTSKHYLPVTKEITEKVLKQQNEYCSVVEECDVYTTQNKMKKVSVWHVNPTAFKQLLEQVEFETDDSFDWDKIEDIPSYLVHFVEPIKKKLKKNIHVLYDENEIDEKIFEGVKPYDGQVPIIQGGVETLKRKHNRFVYLAARQGTGKTLMSIKMNHVYQFSKGNYDYKTLIIAPATTLIQWKEELEKCIVDDIDIIIIKDTNQFIRYYNNTKLEVDMPTYYLVGKETFKLSHQVKHGVNIAKREVKAKQINGRFGWEETVTKTIDVCICPDCGIPLKNPLRKTKDVFFTEKDFDKPKKSNYKCSNCGSVLFQAAYNKTKKTSLADFIQRRNIKFDSLILDEIHEANNFNSIIGKTTRDIMKQAKKIILLSGTISNGYASSIYNILFSLMPNKLKKYGVFDKDKFVKTYGTLLGTQKIKDSDLYKSSRIEVRDSSMKEVEGINPIVYTQFFASNFIFAELEDIKKDLPELKEYYVDVKMTDEMIANERKLRDDIEAANAYSASFYNDSVVKHYTNNPFYWKEIPFIFKEGSEKYDTYVQPINIEEQVLPKEKKLIEICKNEKKNGRKTWVYIDFVTRGKYVVNGLPLQDRLAKLLEVSGLKVFVLRSTVKPIDRKEVIEKNKDKYDVFISHPKLVSVGVNLQFCANYVFYSPSYHVNTVRQSKLRGRRVNASEVNHIYHLYYTNSNGNSLEDEIMERYQLKNAESMAIESVFDTNIGNAKRTASGLGAKIEKSLSKF